ncbi:Uncharacterized conserved protein, DUF305 family [Cnuella takakiae]|uniref:Uncharacterized conserved protein, DUF305 family n=1 Tax=Cnuella takakiae TaxID=1302690 RepID=A0A1M4SPP9_9BACT|nr:DUF305 domain-containing protein [Cnuella takakiae]OLY94557.1 hypothetical protein BUE76_23815 [Cnuella takakiae]SHE33917.1 Uncharacterized conserved protein, DUF305 family [Cnuella takakiae]
MKNTLFVLGCTLMLVFTACDKEDATELVLQSHDNNRMMDSMHAVMDRMEAMTPTNDPEVDFPTMMIMHHQAAINMGNVQIQDGESDTLKRFSQKIIAAQQMEIQELSTILAGQTVNNSVPAFTMEQMDHMMKMDQVADIQLITGNIDNDFATLMIQHHNSAIENSEAYLMYGNNAELKAIAQKMIMDQKMEIKELSDWLKANKR